jgi:hypothetical protein
MNRKLCLTLLTLLVLLSVLSAIVFAEISVGVKKGDWIEYNVSFTGEPPTEHDAIWARMEVESVEGKRVKASFTSHLSNGAIVDLIEDLDFESGRLIDLFIIPANLDAGDQFYDNLVGNVTIDRVEVRMYFGATRSVVHGVAVETDWYWDKSTGVVVEARTSSSVYTLDTTVATTNLWSPQILGLDSIIFYSLVIAVLAVVVIGTVVLVVWRKKVKT